MEYLETTEGRKRERVRTGNGMIPLVLRSGSTVTVAVEARHGFLGEERERFFVDCSAVEIVSQCVYAL